MTMHYLSIQGIDKPGLGLAIFKELQSQHITHIHDLSQDLAYGRLSLQIITSDEPASNKLEHSLKQHKLHIGQGEIQKAHHHQKFSTPLTLNLDDKEVIYVLKFIRPELFEVQIMCALFKVFSLHDLNINTLKTFELEGLYALEIRMSPLSKKHWNKSEFLQLIKSIARDHKMDFSFFKRDLYRFHRRAVLFDMDSTLIEEEVIDELGREAGVHQQMSQITNQAMQGEINFSESLKKRVSLLKGLRREQLEKVYQGLTVRSELVELITFLKQLGLKIYLVSGGFHFFADRLKEKLGLDQAYANELTWGSDGTLAGDVKWPCLDAQKKKDILLQVAKDLKISPSQIVAIGDGANDLEMLRASGLGIAFHAKPLLREHSDSSLDYSKAFALAFFMDLL